MSEYTCSICRSTTDTPHSRHSHCVSALQDDLATVHDEIEQLKELLRQVPTYIRLEAPMHRPLNWDRLSEAEQAGHNAVVAVHERRCQNQSEFLEKCREVVKGGERHDKQKEEKEE